MRRAPLYALYVADAISLVGNVVTQVAIPWFVLVTTGSPTLTGLAVFFNFLPVVIAGVFGGVLVDRVGFRTMSVAADLASAAAVAAIPLLHGTVGLDLWELMLFVFAGALLDAPGATARQSLFPDAVQLAGVGMERATGIRTGIQQGSTLVGGPIGGLLVAALGATNALWLDAGSFLVSAALVATVVPAAHPVLRLEHEAPRRFLGELSEGMRFIWEQRLLRAIVLTVLLTNLLDSPFPVIMSVFARDQLGGASDLGFMYGVFGGAALAGALAYGALGKRLPRRRTFVCCFAVVPFMYLTMATLPPLAVALTALAVCGFASGPINPLLVTVEYELVPVRLRGRVLGAVRAGAWASVPGGVLLGGILVGTVGLAPTFLGIGLCYLGVTAYGFLNPAFRELDQTRRETSSSGFRCARRDHSSAGRESGSRGRAG